MLSWSFAVRYSLNIRCTCLLYCERCAHLPCPIFVYIETRPYSSCILFLKLYDIQCYSHALYTLIVCLTSFSACWHGCEVRWRRGIDLTFLHHMLIAWLGQAPAQNTLSFRERTRASEQAHASVCALWSAERLIIATYSATDPEPPWAVFRWPKCV